MTTKKVQKILIIISIVILTLGIIIGIGVSNAIVNNIPTEEINVDGANWQGVMNVFGNIGARMLGFAIICYTIFIDIMIWIIYGIVIFTKKIINKLNENKKIDN